MVRSTKKLCISASIAGLFAGCTAVAAQEASYTPPPPGSSWQMSQRNTGSFGRDAEVVTTRGEDVNWQGSNLAKYTLSNNGVSTLITPEGKWERGLEPG